MAKPVMLIVDDVEMNRAMLTAYFDDEYTILEAGDGDEGLRIIEEQPVDIVLLDLVMPSLNGYEVLSRIKSSERYAALPVIVMTAYTDGQSEVLAMEMGADDYIQKPYNPTVVQCRVRNVMGRVDRDAKARQVARMKEFIEHDSLTAIYNKETFCKKVAQHLQKHADTPYCMLYWNIHSFKVINDLFGTQTGDRILCEAANYFLQLSKETQGICGRVEADRFSVCLPQDKLDMEHITKQLDIHMQQLGINSRLTFLAGIYPITNITLPVDQMLDRAHMALNSLGANFAKRYASYDDQMREKLLEEQVIVREMDTAVKEDQFCAFFQPIYNLHTNECVSAEALVRWLHPEKGLISPGKFLPVFEKNGFITRLDRIVWEKACQCLAWQKEHCAQVTPISINVSRLDFYAGNLLEFLLGLIKKYDLETWMLKLEITESAYVDNPRQLQEISQQFHAHGFPILMDDFGSGYSSLNMLRSLPVDILKVDMVFVRDLDKDETTRILMRDIVQMDRDMGMHTVIEGVEPQSQLDLLRSIGCQDIQGYYFSKPLPHQDFKDLLNHA